MQTIAPAVLPPPNATEFYSYTQFYTASQTKNGSGGSAAPGFHLDVVAEAARVVHTWGFNAGGVHLSSGAILAGNYINLHVAGQKDNTLGLNLALLTPLYLTYNTGNLSFLFGPGVSIPVGHFDSNRLVNPTTNYYSYIQELAVTYFATPKLELSAETTITFNGTNPDTDYHSGALVNTDFGVNYAAIPSMPNLKFGINGYYAQQFQDDTLHGVSFNNGNRLKKLGLGLQVIYFFNPAAGIALKWQHEFDVRNGPQGDRIWAEFVVPL
ncbi:SphA family protein [Paraburkholderia tropica]|uniref:SphA family protein n=1 Tax=Paraburkholderia tropica TaxID=92647 RepID=UPI001620FF8B|nr:transporter [Paraburkholderia tropica]MBB2983402.1 hypothetical protein [Paraburkholderia tropica]